MSFVKCKDSEGFTVQLAQYEGVFVPPSPGIIHRMEQLKDMAGRDDDTLILAYPKSGTHWVWTIGQMLKRDAAELIVEEKTVDFLEFVDRDIIDKKPSPRVLNTHVRPRHLPDDMVKRKCNIIYIQRNPKDIFVSFFHFCKNFSQFYFYDGTFTGFFELMMKGEIESGSWFDYTLEFEEFFKLHPDIPVLRLHYEDMKENLLDTVKKISELCEFRVRDETVQGITDACTFNSMKKFRVDNVTTRLKNMWRDGNYGMYRKGVIGDWKNYFTVAQNERFEAECERRLSGSGIEIRWRD